MSQLLCRGTRIEDVSAYSASAGSGEFTIEIKCRSAWSEPVCQAMGWTPEPEGFGNGKLEGSLTAVSMALEPNKKELKDYAIDISVGHVGSFKHIAKTEDGEIAKRELEFVVTASGENAIKALPYVATYIEKCGPGDDRGACKLTYNANVQEKLPGTEVIPEDKPRGRKKAAEAVQ